jgi:RNA polymerase sigma-70 factor (ECF subfamily)
MSAKAGQPSLRGPGLDDVIARCQKGEREAFGVLFDAYHDHVFAIAYGLSANYATACDVVQEVFVKLLTRIRQFQFASSFDSWLYRVVLNTSHDQHRAVRTEPMPENDPAVSAPQQAGVEREEIERHVRAAIAALSQKLREPIVLRYISDLSYEEIGIVLGLSPGTVASRLARGHAALAGKLQHLRAPTGGRP